MAPAGQQQSSMWSPALQQQQQQPKARAAAADQPREQPPRPAGASSAPHAEARRKRLSSTGDLDDWMEPYTGSFYGFFADVGPC